MKYIQQYSDEILNCPYGSGYENCDCEEHLFNPEECDICCYDPRYTGEPGSCQCAEYHKAMERENHWFFKHWDVLYHYHWRNIKYFFSNPILNTKRYLFGKTQCTNCKSKSLNRKWKNLVCPECGEEDLPF